MLTELLGCQPATEFLLAVAERAEEPALVLPLYAHAGEATEHMKGHIVLRVCVCVDGTEYQAQLIIGELRPFGWHLYVQSRRIIRKRNTCRLSDFHIVENGLLGRFHYSYIPGIHRDAAR